METNLAEKFTGEYFYTNKVDPPWGGASKAEIK
jgi:hypothetical protein